MDFKYSKSGEIFNMHSYWTKQPVEAIKYFMSKYSKVGDTVLDPFSGTGMTGVAANELNRSVILNDISPVSMHIAKGYCTGLDFDSVAHEIEAFLDRVDGRLSELYLTKCIKCKKKSEILFSIVGEVWKSKDGRVKENRGEIMLRNEGTESFSKEYIFDEFSLIKVCYKCSCCKTKQYKQPDSNDILKWKNSNFKNYYYPKNEFFGQEPQRNYKRNIKQVWQLYSPRNITALAEIYDEINRISKSDLKNILLFAFTAILFNSSLMSRYRSYENTSIKMGTFYVPPLIKDTNVIRNFKGKLSLVLKNKRRKSKSTYRPSVLYLMENADDLKSIKSNSVDYIYTDPPYSDVINYAELNLVYESWLGELTNVHNEMIVSKFYKKDIDYFASRLGNALKECYRVLKTDSYLTLVFHHPNLEHWTSIQQAIISSGFSPVRSSKPIRLISQSKTSSQHKTKKNSQCFLVFNFKKSSDQSPFKIKDISDDKYRKKIEAVRKEARDNGYESESDQFDYIINSFLFEFKLKNFT